MQATHGNFTNNLLILELFVLCSATDFRKINWIQYMMAMVFPTGRVIFIIRSDFQTTCSLDMTSFPFDSQTCYVDICLQMYPASSVNLTTGKQIITLQECNITVVKWV